MILIGQAKILGYSTVIDRETAEIKGQQIYALSDINQPQSEGQKVDGYYYRPEDMKDLMTSLDTKGVYELHIDVNTFGTKDGDKTYKNLVKIISPK